MHTTLAVQITEQDLEKGIAVDCIRCAGALAVKRALRNRGYNDDNLLVYEGIWICNVSGKPSIRLMETNRDFLNWQGKFDQWKRYNEEKPPLREFILFLE